MTIHYRAVKTSDRAALAQIDRSASPTALCQVYLELDLTGSSPVLSWGTEHACNCSAQPMACYHKRSIRWTLPVVPTADEANGFAAEILPLCESIVAGYSCDWDGHNHVGQLTEKAEGAEEAIDYLTSDPDNWGDGLTYWDASEYLVDDPGSEAAASDLVAEALTWGIVLDEHEVQATLDQWAEIREG